MQGISTRSVDEVVKALGMAGTSKLDRPHLREGAHFMRNALAHPGESGRRVVSAVIATALAQDHAAAKAPAAPARRRGPAQAAQARRALLDEAEEDVLAYMALPKGARGQDPLDQAVRAPQ